MAEKVMTKIDAERMKVYRIRRREMISYDYCVPARTKKEALAIFENEDYDEYNFKDQNSHQFHQYFKPYIVWENTLAQWTRTEMCYANDTTDDWVETWEREANGIEGLEAGDPTEIAHVIMDWWS